jgi:outer membrane scaffolding protein for murein synthesis (MipA/OmpV family)
MDPQKHKQMVNQLFENSAKSQEELDKMTPEERKEYLRGRLKQKLFFNGASRQSTQQKKKMQENLQEKMNDSSAEGMNGDGPVSKKTEKNKKKRDKKKAAKMAAMAENKTTEKAVGTTEASNDTSDEDVVVVKRDSESDYESDEN